MNCCGGNHHDPHGDHKQNEPANPEVKKSSGLSKNIVWLALIGIMVYAIWQTAPDVGIKASSLLIPLFGVLLCPLMMGAMMLLGHKHGQHDQK